MKRAIGGGAREVQDSRSGDRLDSAVKLYADPSFPLTLDL